MFKFQEGQILTPSINGRQELVFKIKIQKTDYTLDDFERMALMFENTTFAVVLAPFQEEKIEDPLPKLRQLLAMAIKRYCEEGGYKEDEETNKLYKRNCISSRLELNEIQLKTEIEKYRVGILEFTN